MTEKNPMYAGHCAYIHPLSSVGGGEVALVVTWVPGHSSRAYLADGRYIDLPGPKGKNPRVLLYRSSRGFLITDRSYVLPVIGEAARHMEEHYREIAETVAKAINLHAVTPPTKIDIHPDTISKFGVMVAGVFLLAGFTQAKRPASRREVDQPYDWVDHVSGLSTIDWIIKKTPKLF